MERYSIGDASATASRKIQQMTKPDAPDPEKYLPYSTYGNYGKEIRTYDRISESEKSLYLWLFYPNSSEKPFGSMHFVPGNEFNSLEELELYAESVGRKLLRVDTVLRFADQEFEKPFFGTGLASR